MRGGVVAMSRGPRPSSSQSSIAAGFCARSESGPGLDGEAVDMLGPDQAAARGDASSSANGTPRAAELVGRRQAGDARRRR